MRFNFEIGPDDNRLLDVKVFGHIAEATIWAGIPQQSDSTRFLLRFGDPWDSLEDRNKGEDAARVAIEYLLTLDGQPKVVELNCGQRTPRWKWQLIPIAIEK